MNYKVLLCMALTLFFGFAIKAQHILPYHKQKVEGLSSIDHDPHRKIYLGFDDGSIQRLDSAGNVEILFESQLVGEITAIDAQNRLRILAFQKDLQRCIYLNQFLVKTDEINLEELTGFTEMITSASDGGVWVFDQVGYELKKYHPQLKQWIFILPLALLLTQQEFEVIAMREYQNRLYVHEKESGILVFDLLGNLLSTIPIPAIEHFDFIGDDLYFSSRDSLVRINLYGKQQRQTRRLPSTEVKAMLLDAPNVYLFSDSNILFYRMPPDFFLRKERAQVVGN